MDPAVMAVVPIESDRVVAYAHDLARAHISPHRLGIEQLASAHLLDAEGAMTRQAQVADVEVIAMTVLPEHGQGTRIAAEETDGGVARSSRPDRAFHPGRRPLVAVPLPHKGLQHRDRRVELLHQRRGDGGVHLRADRLWLVHHDGTPLVTAGDDIGIEGQGAQERDAELPAHPFAAAATEDIRALAAVGAGEGAHVLDDPENWDLHLLEHPQAAAGNLEAHVLWRRHDHHAR